MASDVSKTRSRQPGTYTTKSRNGTQTKIFSGFTIADGPSKFVDGHGC